MSDTLFEDLIEFRKNALKLKRHNLTYEEAIKVKDFFSNLKNVDIPDADCFFDLAVRNPMASNNPFSIPIFIIHCVWPGKHDR